MSEEGFVLSCLEQRYGASALVSMLRKRYRDDITQVESVSIITKALPLDVLALVLGTYGYKYAARLSRVCKRFCAAVQKCQFWARGIRVQLKKRLLAHGILAKYIPLALRDFDPFVRFDCGDPNIPIEVACGWMFHRRGGSKRMNQGNITAEEGIVIGVANRVRFRWTDNGETFTIMFGSYDNSYTRVPGVCYNQLIIREKVFLRITEDLT